MRLKALAEAMTEQEARRLMLAIQQELIERFDQVSDFVFRKHGNNNASSLEFMLSDTTGYSVRCTLIQKEKAGEDEWAFYLGGHGETIEEPEDAYDAISDWING